MDNEPDNDAESRAFTMWIVWGALLVSVFIYGGVVSFAGADEPKSAEELQMFLIVFSAIAAGEIPVIFVLRKMLFFDKLDDRDFDDRGDVADNYFTASIITWALCESIAIYGFMLAFLSGEVIYYFPFAAVAVAMMLYFRPQLGAQLEAFGGGGSEEPDSSDEETGEGQHW